MADGETKHDEIAVLIRYRGEQPPAPAWFTRAVETPYETHWATSDGTQVRYQRWGDPSKPGLLLVHGNGAHAHWYDFIAPYFMADYCVVAMTFAGMGDSEWRERYSLQGFADDILAVCADAGLFDHAEKPTIVAHSFGGFITMQATRMYGDRFDGVMIVDSAVRPPDDPFEGPPQRNGPNRIYADLASGLGRFRLAPPQPCENHYIVDYIARHSLKQVTNAAGQSGWTWKFDPSIWSRFDWLNNLAEIYREISCRLAVMRGEQSVLVSDRYWEYMYELRPDAAMTSIPEAQHHVMLDQPLAFVAAVRAQLAAWRA